MTQLLKKAFEEASRLSDQDQDKIADFILNEIKSESRWEHLFLSSQTQLSHLANEALAELGEGKTSLLDIKKL